MRCRERSISRACNFTVNYLELCTHIIFPFVCFGPQIVKYVFIVFRSDICVFGANFMPKMDLSDISVA